MKISPRSCHFHSELSASEILPLTSSLSLNTELGSSICVSAVLLEGHWDPKEAPGHWFYISKAVAVIWMLFLSPGLAWTSSVLSLPPRVPVWLQVCSARHGLDSEP